MEGGEDDNTDGSSIKPVSSLRSHFEGLKVTAHGNPTQGTSSNQTLGQNLQTIPPALGRKSLDLPRRAALPSETRSGQSGSPPRSPFGTSIGTSSPPKYSHKRPVSVQAQSSPCLTPSVIIEPPPSPSKGYSTTYRPSVSPDRHPGIATVPKVLDLISQHSSRSSTRPSTPEIRTQEKASAEKTNHADDGIVEKSAALSTAAPVPPPFNRADKPKIPAKPSPLTAQDLVGLVPQHRKEAFEKRVSPFSTPPSSDESPSPEKSPSVHASVPVLHLGVQPMLAQTDVANKDPNSQNQLHQKDARYMGFVKPATTTGRRDPRTMGLAQAELPKVGREASLSAVPARANTVSASQGLRDPRQAAPRNKTPSSRHVSESINTMAPPAVPKRDTSPHRIPYRDARQFGFAGPAKSLASEDLDRPDLPPRRAATDAPARPSEDSKPSAKIPRGTHPSLAAVSRSVVGERSVQNPPPAQSSKSEYPLLPLRGSIRSTQAVLPRNVVDNFDEADGITDEPAIVRTDYPDASQANRRPPYFPGESPILPIKIDARVFDVCGSNLCATGYATKVFDLSSGEKIMDLNHGESVKVLAVAFKPASDTKSEGARIWLGNNIGELQEFDVATQSQIATSNAHNRREVVRILRNKRDLWTLDDEGKLFIWLADESGMPNLKYSHQAHRVQKGHSFSMVARDKLWLASGKQIRVYKPGDESSFNVLQSPLTQTGTGDVTSGCSTAHQGGRAYFGHTDGKVTIYSLKDYQCLGNIKASEYKINGLAFVGDYLWAAYKTGKVHVYDTATSPWKVKKDWEAHDGYITGFVSDPSSIWSQQRLEVISIGHDQSVRKWNGMLEDDWIETAMQEKDIDYCAFREIRAAVVTWNVGASSPQDLTSSDFICDAIHVDDPPELLIFGFQEIVDLEDRAVTAKSILSFGKKKEPSNTEQHVSRVYREWRDYLAKCISRYMGLSHSYTELHMSSLIGLFQCVFIRRDELPNVHNLSATNVKCGLKGQYGNKGALVTSFVLDNTSLCFINCHLAAGQTQTSHRNNDVARILEASALPPEMDPDTRASHFVGGGDGTQILDHEICILNGDLNYRIDAIPRDTVINMIKRNDFAKLLRSDQIMVSRRRVSGFPLSPFVEAPINFAPTYKYDVGTDNYDSSEKRRAPAWCDRLLYRGLGRVQQLEYRRHEVRTSDHRPVSGLFKIRIKTIDPAKRAKCKEKCYKQFGEFERKVAAEAR